ncbi:MAG: DUF2807 domain-containing protein [Bacteroidia bacterium]|nr:DUF2807 domain-containing protein [Bacteroidia bacterium]
MKTKLILAALIFSMSACAFSANGEAANSGSESHTLETFYGLVVNTTANVILEQGEKSSIRFEGEARDLKKIETRIENGSLVITGSNQKPLTVYITIGDISLIEVNGSARVYSSQVINSDLLLLKVNGSGSIRLDVRSLSLGMIVKGSGKIYASGSSGSSFTRILGNGKVYAANLDTFYSTEEYSNGEEAYRSTKRNSESPLRPALNLHN